MSISVASVGAQQLVASQSASQNNQSSTQDAPANESSTTVNEPAQSGSANNNAGQSGSNSGSAGSDSNTASVTSSSGASATGDTSRTELRSSQAQSISAADPKSTKSDSALSEATPQSQLDAKAYATQVQETAARDRALAQQEQARQAAILDRLANGAQDISSLFGNETERAAKPIPEVAVPDAIPDRMPPRAGVNT